MRPIIFIMLLLLIPAMVFAQTATPTPIASANYQIVFTSEDSPAYLPPAWIMDADGSNRSPLPFNEGRNYSPACSPNGEYLAYLGGDGLYVTDWEFANFEYVATNISPIDGISVSNDKSKVAFVKMWDGSNTDIGVKDMITGQGGRVTKFPTTETSPSLSPDGTKVAFASNVDVSKNEREIYTINVDGTGLQRLTVNGGFNETPKWSPDGTKIAYVSIQQNIMNLYIINADGSNKTQVTQFNDHTAIFDPAWSPDGTEIAFSSNYQEVVVSIFEIYSINVDGTNLSKLTDDNTYNGFPCWLLASD